MTRIEGPRGPQPKVPQDPNPQFLQQLISAINDYVQSGGKDLSGIKQALSKLHLPAQLQKQLQLDLNSLNSATSSDKMKFAGEFLCDASLAYVSQGYPLSKAAEPDLKYRLLEARANLFNMPNDATPLEVDGFVAEAQLSSAQIFPNLTKAELADLKEKYQDLINLPSDADPDEIKTLLQEFQNLLPG